MGRNLIRAALATTAIALIAPVGAGAATITVNTEADNAANPAECLGVPLDCSLRQAIDKSVDGDTISVPAGHYTVTSELEIDNRDIDIAGTGNPVIDGNHATRVFLIRSSSNVGVSGVTVTGGSAPGDRGGGFYVPGILTLTDSTVTDSDAERGAGIAIQNLESPAAARIIRSTISGNRAEDQGGGIRVGFGDLTLINSTVAGNSAGGGQLDGRGGGIYFEGFTEHIYNSTIVGNTALGENGEGGNLFQREQITERFAVAKLEGDPDYLIKNTIVADGTAAAGANCGGVQPVSQGNNLVNTDGECATSAGMNDVNGAPGVAALQNYGGPTSTRKLLPGSKAIDNGNSSGCTDDTGAPITTDQRGVPRPIGARCDIGAVEFAPPLAVTNQPNSVTKASATITGDVTNVHVKAGTSRFEFGTSTAYGQTFDAGTVAAGASHDPRTQGVTGLSPGTLYHYRIVVTNDDDVSFGKDVTFITPEDSQPGPIPDPDPEPQEPEPQPKPKKPTVRAARAATGCVRTRLGVRLSVHVASAARLRSVVVTIDGKRVKRTTRKRFSVRVSVRHLKPGTHVLRIVATDSGGRKTTLRQLFQRCRVRAQPSFTG